MKNVLLLSLSFCCVPCLYMMDRGMASSMATRPMGATAAATSRSVAPSLAITPATSVERGRPVVASAGAVASVAAPSTADTHEFPTLHESAATGFGAPAPALVARAREASSTGVFELAGGATAAASAAAAPAAPVDVDDLALVWKNLPRIPSTMKPRLTMSFLEAFARDAQDDVLDLDSAHNASIAEREVRKVYEIDALKIDDTSYLYAAHILACMARKKPDLFRLNAAAAQGIVDKLIERHDNHEIIAAAAYEERRRAALLTKQLELISRAIGGLKRSSSPARGYATPEEFFGRLLAHKRFGSPAKK